MLAKYASCEVLSVELASGGNRQHRRAVAKVLHVEPGFVRTTAMGRQAHRHNFTYEPRPGYLYVRSRAISSRCNDNYDEFPASEIKQAYRTFIGKPVFVNHHNDNHRRARGVIIDAALHEDVNPDGSEDTWTEVLMEVDAVRFPKLAEAIIKGEVDRTSMGTDVAYSKCSFCGNKASNPVEYCKHIPKMKGQRIHRTTASGQKEAVLVREICYGLGFFENSLLVEQPADPTAYFLGVEAGPGVSMAKSAAKVAGDYGDDDPFQAAVRKGLMSGRSEMINPGALLPSSVYVVNEPGPHGARGTDRRTTDRDEANRWARELLDQYPNGFPIVPWTPYDRSGNTASLNEGFSVMAKTASIDWDGEFAKLALGEIVAPAEVDTLRDENCPVCGESDSYDGDICQVCNFVRPPDEFMDPDLEKAKSTDLRQQADDLEQGTEAEQGDLQCDNCGAKFQSDSDEHLEDEDPDPGEEQDDPKDDEDDEKKPPFGKKQKKDSGDSKPSSKTSGTTPAVVTPQDGKDRPPASNALPKPKDEERAEEGSDENPETAHKAGDTCPQCGKGTLQPVGGPPADEDEDDQQDEDKKSAEDDKDGEGKPSFLTDKKSSSLSNPDDLPGSGDSARTTGVRADHGEGADVTMRPALAALAEQQKTIDSLKEVVGTIADLAGMSAHPKVVALLKTADVDNPAQPIPDPASEAPVETTEQALAPDGKDDVTDIGSTPITDVSADATTSVDSTETVLDTPLDLNEQDVQAPVAGTEEVRPLDEVKTETEVRAGTGSDEVAFPLQGDFAQRATTGSSRAVAAIRLARLRMQAGLVTEADADDLSLGEDIANSTMADESMQAEIETISRVLQANSAKRAPVAPRHLVPQRTAAQRTVPSFTEDAVEIPMQTVASGPNDEEFLFE